MSQVKRNCGADNVKLAIEKGKSGAPAMVFQAQVGTQRQADVVALRTFQAKLSRLNASKLLEGAMIHLDQPSPIGVELALWVAHRQAAGRPVVRVAVWVNRPQNLDHAVAAQMHLQTAGRNRQRAHCLLLTDCQADLAVGLQARQPVPTAVAHQLQVVQTALPTVERHQRGLETARLGLLKHDAEMVVLAQAILRFVIQAVVAGQTGIPIRPHQADEVDPLHHCPMLTRPMAAHQRHLAGIRLVQRCIINDQHACTSLDTARHFDPQRVAIRWQTLQQARVGVVRRFVLPIWMAAGGFQGAKNPLSRNQKVDVVVFAAFRCVHPSDSSSLGSTA